MNTTLSNPGQRYCWHCRTNRPTMYNRCSVCGAWLGHDSVQEAVKRTQDIESMIWGIVLVASQSATCPRASCGAALVRDKRIIATGFNGAPPGDPHCIDVGCLEIDGHCKRTVHAEANAIFQAAMYGPPTKGAVMYTIYRPCRDCLMAMASAGISDFKYLREYNSHAPNDEIPAAMAGSTRGASDNPSVPSLRVDTTVAALNPTSGVHRDRPSDAETQDEINTFLAQRARRTSHEGHDR